MKNITNIYQEIFYSTTKYVVLKNFFMVITGLCSIFIVRLLTPAEYGKWSLVWQLIGTLGPIISLGFLSTLAKFIPEYTDIEKKKELFSQAFYIVLIAIFTSSILYIIGINAFPEIFPKEIKDIKFVFMIFIITIPLINICEGFYRGLGKFNQWAIIDGLRSALIAMATISLLIFLNKKFEVIFYTYFWGSILFSAGLYLFLHNNIRLTKLKLEREIVSFCFAMMTGLVVYFLSSTSDFVLLRTILKDPVQVGYYSAGIRLPMLVEYLLLGLLPVPFLYYFSHPDFLEKRNSILRFSSRMLGVFFGLISIIFFAFAKEIIIILFGELYENSITVFRYFSFILFLWGYSKMLAVYFIAMKRPWIPVIILLFSTTISIFLNILLIPKIKFMAPVVGRLALFSFNSFIFTFILYREKVLKFDTFTLLFFSIAISVIIGECLHYYLSIPTYLIVISTVKLVRFSDFMHWYTILVKKYD